MLAKLKISKIANKGANGTPQVSTASGDVFTCQFNPADITVSKTNQWTPSTSSGTNTDNVAFAGGASKTMTINLFFDATDTGNPVTDLYKTLYKFLLVDSTKLDKNTNLGEPPWVQVQWGTMISFTAVVESLEEKYTFFKPDGTPLRAEVAVTIRQIRDDGQMGGTNPTTRTEARRTWVVQEGDRLDLIAYHEYGDAAAWRHIAESNHIDDPLALAAGAILLLPPLHSV